MLTSLSLFLERGKKKQWKKQQKYREETVYHLLSLIEMVFFSSYF